MKQDNSIVRNDAQKALQYFFQVRPSILQLSSLLITFIRCYKPSISTFHSFFFNYFNSSSRSPVYSSHSGNIHSSTIVRTTAHRRPVTDWLPQVERRPEVKIASWTGENVSPFIEHHIFLGTKALLWRQRKRTLRSW